MTRSQFFEYERQRRERQRAMSIDGFCKGYGIGRTKAYEEINAGRLKARKAGRRTIITADDAEDWLSRLPALQEALDEAAS
jgi:Helix-turn-helix domain